MITAIVLGALLVAVVTFAVASELRHDDRRTLHVEVPSPDPAPLPVGACRQVDGPFDWWIECPKLRN